MSEISVIILTKNEGKNIDDCIASIPENWEIILIDDNSDDKTIEIVNSMKRKISIYSRDLDGNFSKQRNFGLSKVSSPWVLFLDADERISPQLKEELELKTRQTIYSAFQVRRIDHMWGTVLRFGELKNLWLTRFARKESGIWKGLVHETWDVTGRIGKLKNELDHFPHQTIKEFLSEINQYSTLRAEELFQKKKSVSFFDIIAYPKAKFIQNYFIRFGFKDGIPGFLYAILMSFHSFLVRGKLWLLYQKK